ncbi:MAG: hypothetical protein M1827_002086 [Pycnora praestabilis]|nr:MAG: hypothetical protein M1827_002086 [Pycnora praestabilis]
MAFNFLLPLRIVQALFALIVLALTAYVAHWFHEVGASSPSQDNFLLFSSIWTFLALAYLTLTPWMMPSLAHKFGVLAVEAITMLFWFAGFIALAVYINGNLFDFCSGGVCSAIKAACVFGAFEWLLFLATTVLAALHVFRSRNGSAKAADNFDVHQGV